MLDYALKTDCDRNMFKKKKKKRCVSWISEAVCVALHCNVHIISEHTSKISNQSAQYARQGQWTVSPLWERRRIWLMCSRSPRLWLIIITGCWNNDFPSACSASRRTRGIWRFFLWWLNTWVWIWGIKAGLDTTKCALWSSVQVINSALARTVNCSSWIIHNSATDIVFFGGGGGVGGAKKKKCDGVSPSHFFDDFHICGPKTNDDCCTFLIGNKINIKHRRGTRTDARRAGDGEFSKMDSGLWKMTPSLQCLKVRSLLHREQNVSSTPWKSGLWY